LAFTPGLGSAARAALEAGAPIFCDAAMVAAGIARGRLPAGNAVICGLDDPGAASLARRQSTTRSAAAVELWDELSGRRLGGCVAIGNAPTALLRLLELIESGSLRPAAVLAFPVGFVGAAEAKEELIARRHGLEYLTLRGRRGGSALAAAAVNALLGPPGGSP